MTQEPITKTHPVNKVGNLSNVTRSWFIFTMLYLVIDYGRPQDVMPFLGYIKPGMWMIVILTLYLLLHGKLNYSDTKQTRLIWLFIILLASYTPLSVNNFMAYNTLKTMLLFMPFILSIIVCVNSSIRLRITIYVCLVIMIYISIYSLQHHGVGSGNYFNDENDLALYINMWLPFCFYLFLYEKTLWRKLIFAFGLFIGLMSVVVSFSRGGFIGLVAMTFVLWLFSHRKILTLVIIALISLFLYIYGGQEYWKEMSTVTDTKESTAENRILSWKTGWDMFLDNPLGVGGNNFQVRFPEYQRERFSRGMWGRVAHSLWFTLIPETGIIGTIIYLTLLYYNIKDIFHIKLLNASYDEPESRYLFHISLAMLASLAGFFASATFLSVLYYPHYWYMTAIIVATANIARMKAVSTSTIDDKMLSHAVGSTTLK